jgi:hypothetical protein
MIRVKIGKLGICGRLRQKDKINMIFYMIGGLNQNTQNGIPILLYKDLYRRTVLELLVFFSSILVPFWYICKVKLG